MDSPLSLLPHQCFVKLSLPAVFVFVEVDAANGHNKPDSYTQKVEKHDT